jgi:hypothetical protein
MSLTSDEFDFIAFALQQFREMLQEYKNSLMKRYAEVHKCSLDVAEKEVNAVLEKAIGLDL